MQKFPGNAKKRSQNNCFFMKYLIYVFLSFARLCVFLKQKRRDMTTQRHLWEFPYVLLLQFTLEMYIYSYEKTRRYESKRKKEVKARGMKWLVKNKARDDSPGMKWLIWLNRRERGLNLTSESYRGAKALLSGHPHCYKGREKLSVL